MNSFRQLVLRWLVPGELQQDADTRLQAIRAIVFGIAMVFWAPVFSPIYYLLGSPRGGVMIVMAAIAILISMLSLQVTKSVYLTGNLITGAVFAVLVALATVSGGIHAASLWWLASVPILALVLCGTRTGIAWAVASCGAWVFFLILSLRGIRVRNDITDESGLLLDCAAACGIILCAASLTVTFKMGEAIARRDLKVARDASELANRAKSTFLANMSHELRTPMNAIMGMTGLVLESELRPDQRDYLNVVRDSSESLLVLIDDVLDFTKIDSHRLALDPRPFDLDASFQSMMQPLAERAKKRNLTLEWSLAENVPRTIIGDELRLRQVIVNLVDNAIKFTEAGGVVIQGQCDAQAADMAYLSFSIQDSGIGIPPDRQRVIFDVFEQADVSSTRRFGGTGLGLAISSQLVKMMQGQLQVRSELGRGSTFVFNVVVGVTDEDSTCSELERLKDVRNARILVVDANPVQRQGIAEMLQSWNMTVNCVGDPYVAIGLMYQAERDRHPFHLLLVDSSISTSDGVELSSQIRNEHRLRCPIVMMLAEDEPQRDIEECRRMGVTACIRKPVTQPALLDVLQEILTAPSVESQDGEPAGTEDLVVGDSGAILLVEDSLVNQTLATAILKKAGFCVSIANNGREAIEILASTAFDLVLMDVQMPEMDGLQATRLIRQKEQSSGQHVNIVALTAHALEGDRERCLEAGMDDYIPKPIQKKRLLETIRTVLQRN